MNDKEALKEIKNILQVSGEEFDATIMPMMLGVKGYMSAAGVVDELIYSKSGIAALAVGTNDLWNLSSGDAKFSSIFLGMVKQLQLCSLFYAGGDEDVPPEN